MVSIEEIMTPAPISLKETDTLGKALSLMNEKHIHHIPVMDDNNRLVGLVSHRDILAASGSTLRKHPKDQSQRNLSEVMTRNLISTTPQSDILKAARYIHDSRHGCLPVLDNGELVGIVTEYDFVEVAINLLERRQDRDLDNLTDFHEDDTADWPEIDVASARNWD